ncbi:hypothetical protein [Legionella hackeliae]|uniref:Coiled-coil-containing protein n=1 Tax=Legionella hackeliae TaxID=449 RepID=A0A0A8UNK3_LEGHA|nr:hypothetical protein [Legionella hackeliae]KTD13756.1 coiled-coil-containing protein [Legionella hackeliae]CEK10455.1 protein of unknown function [Legionella hackeliae]STX47191.1 coiled-coil-containing protein [Legionella hackeliae]
MSKNTLFNFIDLLFSANLPIPQCKQVELDRNKEDSKYYRLELDHNQPVILGKGIEKYTLTQHHISIYETENSSNPQLSQYHYTAYFSDANGKNFRLHVYFNANDELTMKAVFSREDKEGFTPIEAEKLESEFINLATTNVQPIIAELRKRHCEKIKELEERYSKLQQEAAMLFQKKDENKKAYLDKLNSLCDTLEYLIPLVKHGNYKSILRFYLSLKRSIDSAPAEIESLRDTSIDEQSTDLLSSTTEHESEETKTERTQDNDTASENTNVLTTHQIRKVKKQHGAHETLNKLNSQLSSLKELDRVSQANGIEELLLNIENFSLKYEQNTDFDLTIISELQNLHLQVRSLGEKILPALLLENQLDLAQKLVSWHHLLDEKYILLALQKGNSALLDFVLTYGDFNLNYPITFKGQKYSSPVHFCFERHDKQFPMTDCLSVLLKHGASVCVPDNKTGLPLAYFVMSATDHPFKQAFLANRDRTLDSIQFLKEYRLLLKNYLNQTLLKPINESISDEIDYCSSRISALGLPVLNTPSTRILQKKADDFVEKHLSHAIKRLSTDAEIKLLIEHLDEANRELLKLTGTSSYRHAQIRTGQTIVSLEKIIKSLDIKFDDIDMLKKATVQMLEGSLELVNKRIQYHYKEQELRGIRSKNGQISRTQKKQAQKLDKLRQEISELEKKYDLGQRVKSLSKLQGMKEQFENITQMHQEFFKNINNITSLLSSLQENLQEMEKVDLKSENEDSLSQEGTLTSTKKLSELITKFSTVFNFQNSITNPSTKENTSSTQIRSDF